MAHDQEYFRRRAAEARAAALRKDGDDGVEEAGQLALAYAALARRKGTLDVATGTASESAPMMLRD